MPKESFVEATASKMITRSPLEMPPLVGWEAVSVLTVSVVLIGAGVGIPVAGLAQVINREIGMAAAVPIMGGFTLSGLGMGAVMIINDFSQRSK